MSDLQRHSGLLSGAGFTPSIDSLYCVYAVSEGRVPHG
jgi:hypothetical protein